MSIFNRLSECHWEDIKNAPTGVRVLLRGYTEKGKLYHSFGKVSHEYDGYKSGSVTWVSFIDEENLNLFSSDDNAFQREKRQGDLEFIWMNSKSKFYEEKGRKRFVRYALTCNSDEGTVPYCIDDLSEIEISEITQIILRTANKISVVEPEFRAKVFKVEKK